MAHRRTPEPAAGPAAATASAATHAAHTATKLPGVQATVATAAAAAAAHFLGQIVTSSWCSIAALAPGG